VNDSDRQIIEMYSTAYNVLNSIKKNDDDPDIHASFYQDNSVMSGFGGITQFKLPERQSIAVGQSNECIE
jgi:hypothetical protein